MKAETVVPAGRVSKAVVSGESLKDVHLLLKQLFLFSNCVCMTSLAFK